MAEMGWREASEEVLPENGDPMHYTEIAQEIARRGLRTSFGATPAASVAAAISLFKRDEGDESPFISLGHGYYRYRYAGMATRLVKEATPPTVLAEDETGFINAFGMYWRRDKVLWTSMPRLLGQQQLGSLRVDFCQQKGVYLLHDGNRVVYVGRTTGQPLGLRLGQHTSDRLNGRWDRFSWFGILSVQENGTLSDAPPDAFNVENLIATMEALLIEGLEPPQNRKRGDDFNAVEFQQVEDPEIEKKQIRQLMDELRDRV